MIKTGPAMMRGDRIFKGCMVLKNMALKVHSWMVKNLEEPFLKAEMAKAVPSEKRNGTATAIHITVAGVLVLIVCWLFTSVA